MGFCVAESSGESESSDDSDIEGETASALFMVVNLCGAEKLDISSFFLLITDYLL